MKLKILMALKKIMNYKRFHLAVLLFFVICISTSIPNISILLGIRNMTRPREHIMINEWTKLLPVLK